MGNALADSDDAIAAAAIGRALAAARDGAETLVREHIDWALAQRT